MDVVYTGKIICEARKSKGLTQQQLAEKLNVTNKAVSKWECGVNFPDISLLKPLAKALGIPLLQLFSSGKLREEQAIEIAVQLASQETESIKKALWKRWLVCIVFAVLIFISQLYLSYTIFHAGIFGLPQTLASLFILPFSIIAIAVFSIIQLKKL